MTAAAQPFDSQTDDQRRAALVVANDVRARRADLRARIRSGATDPVAVIVSPPEWARTMKASAVLGAIPKVGPVRVRMILAAVGVAKNRTLGGLTARQRRDLSLVLGGSSGPGPEGV